MVRPADAAWTWMVSPAFSTSMPLYCRVLFAGTNHIDGPLGVRGRNSNNDLIREKLGWDYSQTLEEGIRKTYNWIKSQIDSKKNEN